MPTSVLSHSAAYVVAERQLALARAARAARAAAEARLWAEVDGLGLSPEQFRAYAQMSADVDARRHAARA
jgi:hypothetical protein